MRYKFIIKINGIFSTVTYIYIPFKMWSLFASFICYVKFIFQQLFDKSVANKVHSCLSDSNLFRFVAIPVSFSREFKLNSLAKIYAFVFKLDKIYLKILKSVLKQVESLFVIYSWFTYYKNQKKILKNLQKYCMLQYF